MSVPVRELCEHTKPGKYDPSHTHECKGVHQDGMHMCGSCRRWFA
jgi:hypothetical protein